MSSRAVFVTPTYAADIERFRLQRLSIRKCGITIPQVAVVPPEDMHLFQREVNDDNLTILSSADVLAAAGFASDHAEPSFAWIGCTRWVAQQIIKIAFPSFIAAEAVVCLDSDVCFLKSVSIDDFFDKNGKLKLWEEEDRFSDWFVNSWHFLKLPGEPLRHYNYVFMLFPLHRQIILDLQTHISAKHDRHWIEAFAHSSVTEYMTYGIFAHEINQFKDVTPVSHSLCFTFWPGMEGHILDFESVVKKHDPKAVSIQSSIGWPVSSYKHFIERHWSK